MKFSGYFLTVIVISVIGSILNTLVWYYFDLGKSNPNDEWVYGFDRYIFIYIVSLVISFVSSLAFFILIWSVENSLQKFTLAIHALVLLIMLTIMIAQGSDLENYLSFLSFYIPGLLSYNFFVFRKRPNDLDDDLLDR